MNGFYITWYFSFFFTTSFLVDMQTNVLILQMFVILSAKQKGDFFSPVFIEGTPPLVTKVCFLEVPYQVYLNIFEVFSQ